MMLFFLKTHVFYKKFKNVSHHGKMKLKKNNALFFLLFIFLFLLLILFFLKKREFFETNKKEENYKLIILACFKNETMNLKIWIEHYLWQGVEKFYLIDNDSTDNPLNILQPYIDTGIVNYSFKPKKHKQMNHYIEEMIENKSQNKTKWLIICDLDEFFYGNPNKLIDVIDEFQEYDVVCSNWKMFGSNNFVDHPKDIRKSLLLREKNLHQLKKYIVQIKNVNYDDMSLHDVNNSKIIIENDKIKLNHYPIQSLEFFTKVKMTRGDNTHPMYDKTRNMNYFHNYDKNSIFKDTELKDLLEADNQ